MAKKYTEQATAASLVRYGPELSALTALLKQAEEDRDLRIRQAKHGRQYSVGAVESALPQIRSAYQGATNAITPAFENRGGLEAGALGARMGEAEALAKTQLEARRVSAIEGEGAARTQALKDFRSDRGKIGARALDITREQGAFVSQTIGELTAADEAAKAEAASQNASLTQSERNSIRSSGFDPDQPLPGGGYAPLPGGKADPKAKPGKGWATLDQQAAAGDEIGRLLTEARENKAAGESRADTADLLLTGVPKGQRPVYKTDSSGKQVRVLNPDGTQKTVDDPGFDAAKSQLLASAALDMAYDGHLSRRNQRLLHQRGIKLKPLGLKTYGEWKREQVQRQAPYEERIRRGEVAGPPNPAYQPKPSPDSQASRPQNGPASVKAILANPNAYTPQQLETARRHRNNPKLKIFEDGTAG